MKNWFASNLLKQADGVLAVYQSQRLLSSNAPIHEVKGQSLKVELRDLELSLGLRVGERVELFNASTSEQVFDCVLRCNALLLPQLKQAERLPELIKSEQLQLEGNIQVASRIADHLAQTQFDSEEWLSGYLGDVPSHLFCKGLNKLTTWLKYRKAQSQADLIEWLQDEIRLLPLSAELRIQRQQIEALNEETTQLCQRVARLQGEVTHEPH